MFSARSVVNQQNLGRMIQESLRDIPSDEDVSSGEDDPNLLVSVTFLLLAFYIVYNL